MKRITAVTVGLLVVCLGLAYCWAQSEGDTPDKATKKEEPKAEYIGAASCKMCHNTTKMGKQYKVWSEGPHAKAFAALASEEALALAKKAGVKGSPQEAAQCLKCHSTAAGLTKAEIPKKMKLENGVECETCHGPGSLHKKMMAKKKGAEGTGLVATTEKTCVGCHNEESPTYKKFEYAKATAAIAHLKPAKAGAEKTGSEAKPKETSGKETTTEKGNGDTEEKSGSCSH